MKHLLLSAAIAAIALPVIACSREKPNAQQAELQESAAAARVTDQVSPVETETSAEMPSVEMPKAESPMVNVSYLGATDIGAKAFLGEEIVGDNEEAIAAVEDFLIGADGKVERIVYRTGGVGGLGGKKSAVAFDLVTIGLDASSSATGENDLRVSVSMTADQIEAAPDFEQIGDNDYRLATEILGADVELVALPAPYRSAVVDDLIMDQDGQVNYVVVQRSVIDSAAGGDRFAFAYSLLRLEEGDNAGLALDVSAAQFNSANKFEYKQTDAIEEAMETAEASGDGN